MPEKGKQQKDHEAPVPTKKSGKFVFINGDVYDGDYETNQSESIYRHGNGTFNCKNGVIYRSHIPCDCLDIVEFNATISAFLFER